MTHCTYRTIRFSNRKRRKVESSFQGGAITGSGGVMSVSEQNLRFGLTIGIVRLIGDSRCHGKPQLLCQRLHAPCPGHEYLNDHDELHHDAVLQTTPDRDTSLLSASNLCRFAC